MILCVNANAAIDKTVVVRQFRLNTIQRPQQVIAVPGGKGINVARGLQRLGETPVVTGWIGGFNGQFIEAGLRAEGIATKFVQTERESRTCLSILDPDNDTLTEIYERGDPVPDMQIAALTRWFKAHIAEYTAVTCSGSLPSGVPEDFYGELLAIAHSAGVPGLLDSSNGVLRAGLERGHPMLIKPNLHEFSELIGFELADVADVAAAALEVATRYATTVVVSLGADGVVAAQRGNFVQVRPPRLPIQSAVGSGDCTLAGLIYGLIRNWPMAEAARYGVAAGTANALSVGAGSFSRDAFDRVYAQVTIVPHAEITVHVNRSRTTGAAE